MAVALEELYSEIAPKYGMVLQTESCFQKVIEWIHMIEDKQFIKLLHGNELILNTGVPYVSTEWLRDYIEKLHGANAGGLVICVPDGEKLPEEILQYANKLHFPIFTAGWDCPFVELTRMFAEILIKNEQKEMNLITALRNAINYYKNENEYVEIFENHGFFYAQKYVVAILSCNAYRTATGNPKLKQLEKAILYSGYRTITYEERGRLIILLAGEELQTLIDICRRTCRNDKNIYVGIGTLVEKLSDIYRSYTHADAAYQLTKTAVNTNLLWYDGLGAYKLLSNLKEPELAEEYAREVLGPLLAYDEENETDYVHILQEFFENECSILHASKALFCHKNTLTYKLNKIREILGCDILLNENRMKIMLAFRIMKMLQ